MNLKLFCRTKKNSHRANLNDRKSSLGINMAFSSLVNSKKAWIYQFFFKCHMVVSLPLMPEACKKQPEIFSAINGHVANRNGHVAYSIQGQTDEVFFWVFLSLQTGSVKLGIVVIM